MKTATPDWIVDFSKKKPHFNGNKFTDNGGHWHCLMYMFITEVLVKGGVVLDYVILRGVSSFQTWVWQNITKTSEYNADLYNTTANYESVYDG